MTECEAPKAVMPTSDYANPTRIVLRKEENGWRVETEFRLPARLGNRHGDPERGAGLHFALCELPERPEAFQGREEGRCLTSTPNALTPCKRRCRI